MITYREIIYYILDQVKLNSDDSYFTEDHVVFTINKWRALLLKLKYADIKKLIPESNYQTLCLDLTEVVGNNDFYCSKNYLRSVYLIPNTLKIGTTIVYPCDFYDGINITYISKERMRYVGYNKFLRNIIYCSLGPDSYLYFKSANQLFKYLQKVKYTAIFEDPIHATELSCNKKCDSLDCIFPLEESLIPQLILSVVKELLGAAYRPLDNINNASDDLSDIIAWARKNIKSNLLKQIEE